ncbi:MAG TPA: HD domain-containing phosphohydrolase [Candidatus Deferrimicrobiaceae bacterium]
MAETTRVLCVDGDPDLLRYLETLLAADGHEVLAARSGAEGKTLLQGTRPVHVVFAGYRSAAGEGTEFLAEVRRLSPASVRIGLRREADAAADDPAVESGRVYKSLSVPLDGETARATAGNALERFRLVEALRGKEDDVLRSVAEEVELRDPYTRGHCDRVADVALKIASALGLPGEETSALRRGAWLHDCGKIGVPEAILNHPGKLTPEQFAVVKRHPRWGADVARDAGLPDGVLDILLHHHERFDGKGYPSGAGGQRIPLAARIVAVADVFDAATADRPYARGYDREGAMRVMGVMRGGAFDPEVVDALFGVLKG